MATPGDITNMSCPLESLSRIYALTPDIFHRFIKQLPQKKDARYVLGASLMAGAVALELSSGVPLISHQATPTQAVPMRGTYCPRCGERVPDYCLKCGEKLR